MRIGTPRCYFSIEEAEAERDPAQVRDLSVKEVDVESLRGQLRQFSRLQSLQFGWCLNEAFSPELQSEILELKRLKTFTVLNTPLRQFPIWLAPLPKLKELVLRGTSIREIPASIERFERLRKLDLANNDICEVPVEIARLRELRELGLHSTPLWEIPLPVLQMPALRALQLTGTNLTAATIAHTQTHFPHASLPTAVEERPTMNIIFCADPLEIGQPDRAFAAEVEAAREAGLPFEIVNFERLTRDENAELALRVTKGRLTPELAIYRGWMLTSDQYRALYDALQARNLLLINSPAAYRHCHYLPESYERIEAHTPRSIWLSLPDCLDKNKVKVALQTFGTRPIIVKDYVKSRKHEWHEACYIPDASDDAMVRRVVARFVELQGDDLNGGLVFREYVELKSIGAHPQSEMPLSREFRLFFLNGRLLYRSNYWAQDETEGDEPPLAQFQDIAMGIRSRFFTIDVAQKTDGEWIIVELGDGQVAGLPAENEASAFYRALAAMPKFWLFAGEQPMGWSALETGDPPMGCAAGVFYPNENYALIRDVVRGYFGDLIENQSEADTRVAREKVAALKLNVRPANAPAFEPVGGVSVEDFAAELEDESARALNVFGLPHDVFKAHFREAYEGYYRQ